MSPQNAEAIATWRLLDLYGRGLDGFSGLPLPLRLESVDAECEKKADPEAIRWRVLLLEERIYAERVERFRAEQGKKK